MNFIPGYAHCVAVGYNYPGNDIFHHKLSSLSNCNKFCQQNPLCEHLTFLVSNKDCYEKSKKCRDCTQDNTNFITIPKNCGKTFKSIMTQVQNNVTLCKKNNSFISNDNESTNVN